MMMMMMMLYHPCCLCDWSTCPRPNRYYYYCNFPCGTGISIIYTNPAIDWLRTTRQCIVPSVTIKYIAIYYWHVPCLWLEKLCRVITILFFDLSRRRRRRCCCYCTLAGWTNGWTNTSPKTISRGGGRYWPSRDEWGFRPGNPSTATS